MVGLILGLKMFAVIPIWPMILSPSFWIFAASVAVTTICASVLKYLLDLSAAQQKELKRIDGTMDDALTKIQADAMARDELKRLADPKRAAREKARNTLDALWGSACPLCSLPLARDEEIAVCVDCGSALHMACAAGNGGCTKQGCDSLVYLYPLGDVKRWREFAVQREG